jgi:hypothetical protein
MSTTRQRGTVSAASACFTLRREFGPASRAGRHRLLYLTTVLTAVIWLGVLPAAADVLPSYHLDGDIFFNLGPRLFPNDFGTISLVEARFGSVSLSASGVPSPSLIADADIGPNLLPSISGRASWLLDYALEIEGPPGAVPVLIDVEGGASGVANAGASFAVESRWDLLFGGSSLAGDDIRSGQLIGSFGQGFSRTVSLTLAANQLYTLFMLADAFSAATLEGSRAHAHAFVDPVFSFGPGVDPLVYSLNFSPGIGNSPVSAAVPEPASIALFGAVLLALALLRRRSGQYGVPGPRTLFPSEPGRILQHRKLEQRPFGSIRSSS